MLPSLLLILSSDENAPYSRGRSKELIRILSRTSAEEVCFNSFRVDKVKRKEKYLHIYSSHFSPSIKYICKFIPKWHKLTAILESIHFTKKNQPLILVCASCCLCSLFKIFIVEYNCFNAHCYHHDARQHDFL